MKTFQPPRRRSGTATFGIFQGTTAVVSRFFRSFGHLVGSTALIVFLAGCNNAESQPVAVSVATSTRALTAAPHSLSICSFNIQFLGNFKNRDNAGLARLLTPYDVVVIQELDAPPYPGKFPDGTSYKPDPEAAAFFDAMKEQGFVYVLSEEDTGAGETIHLNSAATEWWVTFYREAKVRPADDLPHGFLAAKRGHNPDYDRVPYAFGFRTSQQECDFVLISVHLNPDHAARRQHELAAIGGWVSQHSSREKDFIILGDMNIKNPVELGADTPANFISLNADCVPTNTNPHSPEPYDHVMFNPIFTTEIDRAFGFHVVNLAQAMKSSWHAAEPYPGDPYVHDRFRTVYSDHNPVFFQLTLPAQDDDP